MVSFAKDSTDKDRTDRINPFDPKRFRVSQDFGKDLGVTKSLVTVPVRKPSKEWWFRVHPDKEYRMQTYVIELKEEQKIYLVEQSLWKQLVGEGTFGQRLICTATTRQGVPFLWPLKVPGTDGRSNPWWDSALEAVSRARTHWTRMVSDMHLGAYQIFETSADWPEPNWPDVKFGDLLEVGFKDRHITDLNHPVLQNLRGEA